VAVEEPEQLKPDPGTKFWVGVGTSMFMIPAWQAASAAPWAICRWNHMFVMSTANPTKPRRKMDMAMTTKIVTWPSSPQALRRAEFFMAVLFIVKPAAPVR
jgi:hypothetical protein